MAKKQPITTGAVGGRPPMEDPLQRISIPVRGLVSVPVRQALDQALEMHGCTTSDLLRLALFNLLKKDGLMTDQLRQDHTWDPLKDKGLV
jgi:hypothetical protein